MVDDYHDDPAGTQRRQWYHTIRNQGVSREDTPSLPNLIITTFQFKDIRGMIRWHKDNYKTCDFSQATGPHWKTLLKMMAIKYRPENHNHDETQLLP